MFSPEGAQLAFRSREMYDRTVPDSGTPLLGSAENLASGPLYHSVSAGWLAILGDLEVDRSSRNHTVGSTPAELWP